MPTADEFRAALIAELQDATKSDCKWIDINAGTLHRKLGGYPSKNHHMPTCCNVMHALARAGDEVINEPPKGRGANLTILYQLPR